MSLFKGYRTILAALVCAYSFNLSLANAENTQLIGYKVPQEILKEDQSASRFQRNLHNRIEEQFVRKLGQRNILDRDAQDYASDFGKAFGDAAQDSFKETPAYNAVVTFGENFINGLFGRDIVHLDVDLRKDVPLVEYASPTRSQKFYDVTLGIGDHPYVGMKIGRHVQFRAYPDEARFLAYKIFDNNVQFTAGARIGYEQGNPISLECALQKFYPKFSGVGGIRAVFEKDGETRSEIRGDENSRFKIEAFVFKRF